LYTSRGKTAPNFIPKQRRNLITHQPIEHASSLLRVYQILINRSRMFESRLHRTFGDFVERDALNTRRSLYFTLFLLLCFFRAIAVEFERKMSRNGLAFAIRVRRQTDRIHPSR